MERQAVQDRFLAQGLHPGVGADVQRLEEDRVPAQDRCLDAFSASKNSKTEPDSGKLSSGTGRTGSSHTRCRDMAGSAAGEPASNPSTENSAMNSADSAVPIRSPKRKMPPTQASSCGSRMLAS